jgi:phosphoglycolate phosphatase-like HAD superfamily hydrolase
LFDVDGTLVDTNYVHTVLWWRAIGASGHRVPMAAIHRAIGMGGDRLLDHLLDPDRDRSADELIRERHRVWYRAWWPDLIPLPGAAKLVMRCHARDLRVGLATSAEADELAALRKAIGADDAIDAATSVDDAKESKPAPDILLEAIRAAGMDRGAAVLVGDSVWDVKAAQAAGIPAIGLECGGTSAGELRSAGATEVFADPADLLRHFHESLLGRTLPR